MLAPATGHIALHETGAIEAWGHKVLTLPEANGKITAAQVEEAYIAHYTDVSAEHMVQPGMVYISQPTETGALYSLAELEAISAVCRKRELFFYVDGARLGYGLASPDADFTLADLARLTDIFYIGGTKVGALFGEALVIMNPAIKRDFRYNIKQHGAMLAKGTKEAIATNGITGILTGPLSAASAGITAAVLSGVVCSLSVKPKAK